MTRVVKNSPDDAGDIRDMDSIPGSGISPGGRHGNPRQYSCLENPVDRGTWQPTVHEATKTEVTQHAHVAGNVFNSHIKLLLLC